MARLHFLPMQHSARTNKALAPTPLASTKLTRRGLFRLGGALAAVAAGGVLVACSSDEPDPVTPAEDAAEAPSTGGVVALGPGQLENLLALGVLPAGSARHTDRNLIPSNVDSLYGYVYKLKTVTDCGEFDDIDLGKVRKLEPNTIIAPRVLGAEVLEQLEEIAQVVTTVGSDEAWREDFLTIAEAVQATDRAEELLEAFDHDVETFISQRGESPTVGFMRSGKNSIQILGAASTPGAVAYACELPLSPNMVSGESVAEDITLEQVADIDCQWLFYALDKDAEDPATAEGWADIPAVQAGQAVTVDFESCMLSPSYDSAVAILSHLRTYLDTPGSANEGATETSEAQAPDADSAEATEQATESAQ